jgi:Flp pilus assembly protein TadB
VRFDDELPDFLDLVTVNMRSGMPPAAAFLRAGETTQGEVASAVRAVAESTNAGSRFAEALADQRLRFPPRGQPLIDAIIDTERDGLPARDLFHRLSDDAHAMRRRESERKIRALPVRLTLPLVGLVLPSYVLLAVVPLLASQLTSVVIDPPN